MFHKELSFLFTFLMLLSQQGVKSVKLITCEDETASLSCDRGLIRVLSAAYGRLGSKVCFAGRTSSQLSNTACIITTKPFNLLTSRCNGKSSCSVLVNNAAFTNPCVGTSKYLSVTYECREPAPRATNLVTCESKTAKLRCEQGVIEVLSADYGRLDSTTCAHKIKAEKIANTACLITTKPFNVLISRCNGKRSCYVRVNNGAFSNPCPGTHKYLTVSYECRDPAPLPTSLVTCESDTAELSCAQGVIEMNSAAYGRLDSTTCSENIPASKLANTTCLITSKPLDVLTSRCDGKSSCSVRVNNGAFTNPCPGTHKYLKVSYECRDPEPLPTNLITCESQTTQFGCEQGVIEVLSADYGRLDSTTCSEDIPASQRANTDCLITTKPLNVLTSRCDGELSCSVVVNDEAFTDPCSGTYKYLNMSYACVVAPPPQITRIICQNRSGTISCDPGRRLYIHYANYGRRDRSTCPCRSRKEVSSKCISSQTRILQPRCNGKRSCVLHASNTKFRDRCPKVLKYLEVTYSCQ